MPRRPGMRDDDLISRLHDVERRLDDLEEDQSKKRKAPASKDVEKAPPDEPSLPADTVEGSKQLDQAPEKTPASESVEVKGPKPARG